VLYLDSVGKFAGAGGFDKAPGNSLEHGSIKVRICCEGGGNSVGGQRDNCGHRGTVCRQRGICWRFIGDINGYIGHGGLVVERAVGIAAETGVLVAVGVKDIVLKAEEEVSKGFSRFEVE